MRNNKLKFNIFDLNFILSIWGFAILTSIMPNVESIALRVVFLVLSLFCLTKTGLKLRTYSKDANFYILLLILMLVRVSVDVLMGSLADAPTEGKRFFFIFSWGVMLIPLVSIVSSYDRINWNTVLVVLHLVMFFIILRGVMGSGLESHIEDSGRVALNERQDSSAFGDYSTTLLLLSLVQLVNNPFSKRGINVLYKLLCIAGIVVSFYGVSRGAARGAFVGYLVVLVYFSYCVSKRFSVWLVGALVAVLTVFSALLSWFSEFAPLLYMRMMRTVEEGDTSGREVLFQEAIDLIKDNPLLPEKPIMIYSRFFTYHELYLDVTLYLGVIGGALFVFLILKTLFKIIQVKTQEPVSVFFLTTFIVNAVRGLSGASPLQDAMFNATIIFTLMLLQAKKDLKTPNAGLIRYK